MTLPSSRDITLATGTQIPSTLLNTLQDMIIGDKHGPKTIQIGIGLSAGSGSASAALYVLVITGSVATTMSIPLHIGDRIISADVWIQDDTGVNETVTASIAELDHATGVAIDVKNGVSVVSNNSGAVQKLSLNFAGGNEITVASGDSYFIRVGPQTSFSRALIAAEVTYDRL